MVAFLFYVGWFHLIFRILCGCVWLKFLIYYIFWDIFTNNKYVRIFILRQNGFKIYRIQELVANFHFFLHLLVLRLFLYFIKYFSFIHCDVYDI